MTRCSLSTQKMQCHSLFKNNELLIHGIEYINFQMFMPNENANCKDYIFCLYEMSRKGNTIENVEL